MLSDRRWCPHCRQPRSPDDFSALPGLKVRREVCSECRTNVMARRKELKSNAAQAAKEM